MKPLMINDEGRNSAATGQQVDASPGDLDPSFGIGGKVTTNFFNDTEKARDVAIQPEGKIVVAGIVFNPGELRSMP